jgi:protein-S-isoprenylcysteine O-methyltransferase Ste14
MLVMAIRTNRGWLLLGYAGIGGFLALEVLNRKPGAASSLEAAADDRGTTRALVSGCALAAAAPILVRIDAHPLAPAVGRMGLLLQASGLALRTWSMRVLGASYTRTLRTTDDQRVVDSGPYRLVRHPGYSGTLLTWVGFALTSRSLPVVVLVSALLGRAYRRRIIAEEQLLRRDLPGYVDYCGRTKRLIPFVW